MTASIMWFRRDLRVDDHPAWSEACAAGQVLALFVVDPAFERAGRRRLAALGSALDALDRRLGGALVVRRGQPVEVVGTLAAAIDASTVYVTKDAGPYGRRRDGEVAAALAAAGRRLRGVGSPYAVAPGAVTKADGSRYSVFTPYHRRWLAIGWPAPIEAPARPDLIEAGSDTITRQPAPYPGADPFDPDWTRAWDRFRLGGLDRYVEVRDLPGRDATSRLSAALRFGVVHPRQLLAQLDPGNRAHAAFAAELAWRDFYADVLLHRPDSAWNNLDRRFDSIAVDTDRDAVARFERWRTGHTGFPLVDAGMRQLLATGWMHNRVRMIVASFLVKDLHLPWQWGARHFMRQLADGDLASNSHGWQWAAGSGTDAAPYFRVFNPAAQQERFDPDGEYVGRWIAELGSDRYPRPIVDHGAERVEALARYAAMRNRAGSSS